MHMICVVLLVSPKSFDGKKGHAYAKLLPEGVGNGELMTEGEGALSLGAGDKRSDFYLRSRPPCKICLAAFFLLVVIPHVVPPKNRRKQFWARASLGGVVPKFIFCSVILSCRLTPLEQIRLVL